MPLSWLESAMIGVSADGAESAAVDDSLSDLDVALAHWHVNAWGGAEYLVTKLAEVLEVDRIYTTGPPSPTTRTRTATSSSTTSPRTSHPRPAPTSVTVRSRVRIRALGRRRLARVRPSRRPRHLRCDDASGHHARRHPCTSTTVTRRRAGSTTSITTARGLSLGCLRGRSSAISACAT